MAKTIVPDVTLVCIDCVDVARAVRSLELSRKQLEFERVILMTSLPNDYPHAATILPLRSTRDYSRFVIYELTSFIETPYLLIVQHDGWVVDGSKWNEAWKAYDYVGGNSYWTEPGPDGKGGNGGFSLRSRRLLDLAPQLVPKRLGVGSEDVFLSASGRSKLRQRAEFEERGMTFAPRSVQQAFALDQQIYTGQFGHHQCRFLEDAQV